jgi:hypothetical protein
MLGRVLGRVCPRAGSFEGVRSHRALNDIPLLDAVVAFKRKFYRCNWAYYERATAAEIALKPPEHALAALVNDYRHMQNMIFDPRPSFAEILETVCDLESEIHKK